MKDVLQRFSRRGPMVASRPLAAKSPRRVALASILGVVLLLANSPLFGQVHLTITNLGHGSKAIGGGGVSGQGYDLLAAANVAQTNWQTLGTVTANVSGAFVFIDSNGSSQRFYRSVSSFSGSGFSPQSIPKLASYWNHLDLPLGSSAAGWTDRIQGVQFKATSNPAPTNLNVGVDFRGYGYLTNATMTVPSNFSFWITFRFDSTDTARAGLFGTLAPYSGFYLSNGIIDGYWNSDHTVGSKVPLREPFDLVYSQGTVYTNGVSTGVSIGQPAGNQLFQTLGAAPFEGFIQYVGVWTNYALTATDVTNLHSWTQTNGVTNVTSGLYAWWKLDEGSGTYVADSSGNNHHGIFTNSPTWTNGFLAGGLRFNGVPNQSVLMTNSSDNFANFSVAFWVREISPTSHGYLISKLRASDGDIGWIIMTESAQLRYAEWDPFNWIETSDRNPDAYINDGRWHHFVACRQGTNNAWTYKDASLIRGALVGTGIVNSITNADNIKLGFGTQFDGSTPNAVLDDVRVYNRILSAAEVEILFRWRGQP